MIGVSNLAPLSTSLCKVSVLCALFCSLVSWVAGGSGAPHFRQYWAPFRFFVPHWLQAISVKIRS
jgi:hypothetical protein